MAQRDFILHTNPTPMRKAVRFVGCLVDRIVCTVQEGGAINRRLESRKTEF